MLFSCYNSNRADNIKRPDLFTTVSQPKIASSPEINSNPVRYTVVRKQPKMTNCSTYDKFNGIFPYNLNHFYIRTRTQDTIGTLQQTILPE